MTIEPLPDFDLTGALPFDADADAGTPLYAPGEIPRGAPPDGFWYIGEALTPDAFAGYVAQYDFGPILPNYIVLHHTAIPSASWGRYSTGAVWDANEQGMDIAQKRAKRLRQLAVLRNYYQKTYGWDRGPHLFVDDLFVYLFTPMREVGIHAAQGNSYLKDGRLNYSIGIEVIGYFERAPWPKAIEHNVGLAVGVLKQKLGTFELISGPWAGKVGAHRMYNKPACPGGAIQPKYYLPILQAGYERVTAGSATPPSIPVPSPSQPASPAIIPGIDGVFRCGEGFQTTYAKLGGRDVLGYATSDEYVDTDALGRRCTFMRFERAWLKYVPAEGIKLALLSEVIAKQGQPAGPFGTI